MGRGLIDIKEIKFYKMCYLMQKNTINYIDGKFWQRRLCMIVISHIENERSLII